ncbi:MAG: carboxypeptidase-like regulatory domain-containing protein [Terracidiphilus sp.]
MRKQIFWRGTTLALILMGALMLAHAIDVNARISGTVTDPQGAVLPNVQVTLTNEATGVKQVSNTLTNGTYLFAEVPVGTYTITVAATGFKTYNAKGIVVNIDQQYVEPVQLQVGSTTEEVEVSASNAAQVNTTDMELSNVVNSDQLVELPLITRNFSGLELTQPGVQASSDRFGTYSVAGGETQQSEFLINGADTNDIALNTLALAPNLDAIDQFNLIDGPLNAEYDRNSGGIVSATIKAGTNKFHGDAFEFYRDTFLNTLNYFQKSVTTGTGVVSPYHQNIYGGTVGGPIVHDKLFFFFAYQGTHQRIPDTNGGGSSDVYDAANLQGDFSADDNPSTVGTRPNATTAWGNWQAIPIPSSIKVPGCSASGETWAECAYDLKGVMPTSAFNPIAVALVNKYVPKPNSGTYGYLFNPVDVLTDNQYIGRADYSPNSANQITGLFIYDKSPNVQGLPFTGASLPGFGDVSTHIIHQFTGDYVHQFNASTVNDFSGHYTRFNYMAVEPLTTVDPTSLGFNIHPEIASAANVPTISVGGTNVGFTLGWSTNGPQPRIDQVAQLDDALSKVIGNHTFKFGYDGRRFNVHNPFGAENSGSFSFGGSAYTTGDGGVDFLLGIPAGYGQGSGAQIIAEAFLNYGFAQDTWKIKPTVTLSYGLGYSIDTPLHELQYGGNAVACIVGGENSTIFPGAPTSMVYGGDTGCSNAGQATTRYSELGPRFGFAWAPDLGAISGAPGKFSIRGGFGIYYDRTEEETALQTLETPPFGISSGGVGQFIGGAIPTFADPYTDINGLGSHSNPFPYSFPTKGAKINFAALEPMIFSTYGPNFRAPYAENIQLSVEREFPSRIVARASYVGSLARHNQSTIDANPITPAGHAACLADTTYCGYRGYTGPDTIFREEQSYFFPSHTTYGKIDPASGQPGFLDPGDVSSYASSSYHSLQAVVDKGTSHGLNFELAYTWSHAIDTGSSFENAGFGGANRGFNQYDPKLNVGDSGFDARQRLVFSPIYVTPLVSGHSEYSPINLAVGGWEISAISTLASGFPFDVSYGGSSGDSLWCPGFVYFYACGDAPNQVAPITKANPRIRLATNGHAAYISKTAFANEPIGEFGNTHRDPAHGPGLNFTNMILAKNFYLSQDRGIRLQVRMESDNVFNHTSFGNPGAGWGDTVLTNANSTFGQISGINGGSSARLTQLATKIYF